MHRLFRVFVVLLFLSSMARAGESETSTFFELLGMRRPMTFTVRGKDIYAKGLIAPDTVDTFRKLAYDYDLSKGYTLHLNSPGGIVPEALRLGRDIRAYNIKTMVDKDAECKSMCPFVLLGGAERTVAEGAEVGLHQIYVAGADLDHVENYKPEQVYLIQASVGEIAKYVMAMGGRGDLMTIMMLAPPASMHVLSKAELRQTGLVTRKQELR